MSSRAGRDQAGGAGPVPESPASPESEDDDNAEDESWRRLCFLERLDLLFFFPDLC